MPDVRLRPRYRSEIDDTTEETKENLENMTQQGQKEHADGYTS
jgi:hypothetical protein